MAEKLNAAKNYGNITINAPKHSRLVWAVTMQWIDKENRIAAIALHKCEIEKARIFELLKPLNKEKMFWLSGEQMILPNSLK